MTLESVPVLGHVLMRDVADVQCDIALGIDACLKPSRHRARSTGQHDKLATGRLSMLACIAYLCQAVEHNTSRGLPACSSTFPNRQGCLILRVPLSPWLVPCNTTTQRWPAQGH